MFIAETAELRSMSPLIGIGQHPNLIHILVLPRLFYKLRMLPDSIEVTSILVKKTTVSSRNGGNSSLIPELGMSYAITRSHVILDSTQKSVVRAEFEGHPWMDQDVEHTCRLR